MIFLLSCPIFKKICIFAIKGQKDLAFMIIKLLKTPFSEHFIQTESRVKNFESGINNEIG
jgi:hypothetical protein